MPSPTANTSLPSTSFLEVFRAEAGTSGCMTFERFMALALYHPTVGYYQREQKRVGYGRDSDFFTATSTGSLLGELIQAACQTLLSPQELADYTFVEIGAEPNSGIFTGVEHSFGATRAIRIGEPITLNGKCVVFSNELFDAQPFRRFEYRANAWHELGVQLRDNVLHEISLTPSSLPPVLPAAAPEHYHIDLPLAAVALAEQIAAQPWAGLFVAFDYGKTWRELIEAAPAGTARAYHRHTQSNDLLARPGQQDLTCHICWDWLAAALEKNGFAIPQIETQESFFIRRAADFMARAVTAEASQLSQRKLSLLQLLHHLGQKFQVLWALRQSSSF